MIGDSRKFNIAVVTLKEEGATGVTPGTGNLIDQAAAVNPAVKTVKEVSEGKDEKWMLYLQDAINQVNANKKVCISNASKIQNFVVLGREFSIETGELTATLKLKRA